MSKIGFLNEITTANGKELRGEIRTLQIHIRIFLIENRNKVNERAPDYIAVSPAGDIDIPIGGAWIQKKSQIGDIDFEFLSITIDDPSFPNAFNVAAFKNNNGGWDISWRRRQASQNAA